MPPQRLGFDQKTDARLVQFHFQGSSTVIATTTLRDTLYCGGNGASHTHVMRTSWRA
jgi:hypothetical protein